MDNQHLMNEGRLLQQVLGGIYELALLVAEYGKRTHFCRLRRAEGCNDCQRSKIGKGFFYTDYGDWTVCYDCLEKTQVPQNICAKRHSCCKSLLECMMCDLYVNSHLISRTFSESSDDAAGLVICNDCDFASMRHLLQYLRLHPLPGLVI